MDRYGAADTSLLPAEKPFFAGQPHLLAAV